MTLGENDHTMFENACAEGWFAWGMHWTDAPEGPAEPSVVVELPAVKEMISLVAQGYVTGAQLHEALDAFADRHRTAERPEVPAQRPEPPPPPEVQDGPELPLNPADLSGAAGGAGDRTAPYPDQAAIGDNCPYGCPVCAAARAEFDAIAAESLTHKVRLADPRRHPYAAGKRTLHRSSCPRVARFVGVVEPVGSRWYLAGLPAFAHQGLFSTAWAAGMIVMTQEEAASWVRRQADSLGGTGYRVCCDCLPATPGAGPNGDTAFDDGYWSVETL